MTFVVGCDICRDKVVTFVVGCDNFVEAKLWHLSLAVTFVEAKLWHLSLAVTFVEGCCDICRGLWHLVRLWHLSAQQACVLIFATRVPDAVIIYKQHTLATLSKVSIGGLPTGFFGPSYLNISLNNHVNSIFLESFQSTFQFHGRMLSSEVTHIKKI